LILATVAEALNEIRDGRIVIVCDASRPDGRCDLVAAAESITAEAVNFMAREARGIICLALDHEECERLGLEPVGGPRAMLEGPDFMTTIEAASGVTTGISAADRAHTIRVAADPASGPDDIVAPGHVIPIRVREDADPRLSGNTEAAVDLARLAGCRPAAVICAVMNDDGSMATVADMADFGARHDQKMVTVDRLTTADPDEVYLYGVALN
jgi:3,4-dihydroxy 2-butanone 4-phosphate synthase/GTP cyclohydrolase II